MARRESTRTAIDWKAALLADDVFRELLRGTIQQVLEAEMEEAVGIGTGYHHLTFLTLSASGT